MHMLYLAAYETTETTTHPPQMHKNTCDPSPLRGKPVRVITRAWLYQRDPGETWLNGTHGWSDGWLMCCIAAVTALRLAFALWWRLPVGTTVFFDISEISQSLTQTTTHALKAQPHQSSTVFNAMQPSRDTWGRRYAFPRFVAPRPSVFTYLLIW